jgi:hypothetical protein
MKKSNSRKQFISILFAIFYSQILFGQIDTSKTENNGYITIDSTDKFIAVDEITEPEIIDSSYIKSPKKAALYSLCFPGLGQIYNEKYWKVPIVWSLVGASSYAVYTTFDQYYMYLNDYVKVLNKDTITISKITNKDVLFEKKTKFRKYRDLSVIAWVIIYGLNIIDANVDAHFSNFDVSEDLSLKFSPEIINLYDKNYTFGINLVLYF